MCITGSDTQERKKDFLSRGLCHPSLSRGVLGTRKPLIVNLSVPDVTEKIYRGVR